MNMETENKKSDKYYLLIYYVHSYLESVKQELRFDTNTTVGNFEDSPENKLHTKKIFDYCLTQWNYELSHNQVCNGVDQFLKAHKNDLNQPPAVDLDALEKEFIQFAAHRVGNDHVISPALSANEIFNWFKQHLPVPVVSEEILIEFAKHTIPEKHTESVLRSLVKTFLSEVVYSGAMAKRMGGGE